MISTVLALRLAPDRIIIRELEKKKSAVDGTSRARPLPQRFQPRTGGQTDRHVALSVSGSRVSVADTVISARSSRMAFTLRLSAARESAVLLGAAPRDEED